MADEKFKDVVFEEELKKKIRRNYPTDKKNTTTTNLYTVSEEVNDNGNP